MQEFTYNLIPWKLAELLCSNSCVTTDNDPDIQAKGGFTSASPGNTAPPYNPRLTWQASYLRQQYHCHCNPLIVKSSWGNLWNCALSPHKWHTHVGIDTAFACIFQQPNQSTHPLCHAFWLMHLSAAAAAASFSWALP